MKGVSLYGAALAAVIAMVLLALAFIYRAEQQASLADVAERNCRSIEELKAHVRAEAVEDYANLDRTLRILRLERTEEIEQVARENRDVTLRRFAAREC